MLPTYATACVLVFSICVPYTIFAATAELFGAVYQKMAVVFLSLESVGGYGGGEIQQEIDFQPRQFSYRYFTNIIFD